MSKEQLKEDDAVYVRVTSRETKEFSKESLEERKNADFDEFVKTAIVTRRDSND